MKHKSPQARSALKPLPAPALLLRKNLLSPALVSLTKGPERGGCAAPVGPGAGCGAPCTGKAGQPPGPAGTSHRSTPAKTDATAASLPAAPPRHPPGAHPELRPAPCRGPSTAPPQPGRPRQGPPWAQSSSPCPQPHGDIPKSSTVGVHHGQTSSHVATGGQNPLRSCVHPRHCPERSWLTYRAAPARSRPDPAPGCAAGRRRLRRQLAASAPRPERGQAHCLHEHGLGHGAFPALGRCGGDGGVSPGWLPVERLTQLSLAPCPHGMLSKAPKLLSPCSAGSQCLQLPLRPPACPRVPPWHVGTWHGSRCPLATSAL